MIVPRRLTASRLVVILELALVWSRVLAEGRSDRIVPEQHSQHARMVTSGRVCTGLAPSIRRRGGGDDSAEGTGCEGQGSRRRAGKLQGTSNKVV